MGNDMGRDEAFSPRIADAAAVSADESAAAIERAAAVNEDPEVGEILDHAAMAAEQTVSRVGWLRGFLHRYFDRST
jgi:hypothetical protein